MPDVPSDLSNHDPQTVPAPSIAPQSATPPSAPVATSGVPVPPAINTGTLPLSGSFAQQNPSLSPPPPAQPPAEPMVIATTPPPAGSKTGTYLLMLLLFILGTALGYALHLLLPKYSQNSCPISKEKAPIVCPQTATPTDTVATESSKPAPSLDESSEASPDSNLNPEEEPPTPSVKRNASPTKRSSPTPK